MAPHKCANASQSKCVTSSSFSDNGNFLCYFLHWIWLNWVIKTASTSKKGQKLFRKCVDPWLFYKIVSRVLRKFSHLTFLHLPLKFTFCFLLICRFVYAEKKVKHSLAVCINNGRRWLNKLRNATQSWCLKKNSWKNFVSEFRNF